MVPRAAYYWPRGDCCAAIRLRAAALMRCLHGALSRRGKVHSLTNRYHRECGGLTAVCLERL